MNSIGIVSDINHRGELLVKGQSPRKSGTAVFDVRKQKVGKVLRIFGPVKAPYLLVKVSEIPDNEKIKLLNTELYAKDDGERNRKG